LLTCGQDWLNGLLQLVAWKKVKKFTCYFTFCWEKANGDIFLESSAMIIIFQHVIIFLLARFHNLQMLYGFEEVYDMGELVLIKSLFIFASF
jgi:hypothetical protein